jgi:uncharacterized repeat protein (TIGR01451 family)
VQVVATVAADARGRIVNEATVYGDQGDPHPANNTARSTIQIIPLPAPPVPDPGPQPISDLVVIKHVNHHTAVPGQKLRYTIAVTNKGPDLAAGVKLIDTSRLPLKVLSIHPRRGHCRAGPPIGCALGTLRAGAHTTITITALATVAGSQVNAVAATSSSWDPDPSTSLARAKTRILAVLRLAMSASTRSLGAGGSVTLKLSVTNHNGIALHQLRTCLTLPAGLVYRSSSPTARLANGRYCWSAATLMADRSKTYTVRTRALLSASGLLTASATSTAPGATLTHASLTVHITSLAAPPGGVTG